jgi:hypothetical protein
MTPQTADLILKSLREILELRDNGELDIFAPEGNEDQDFKVFTIFAEAELALKAADEEAQHRMSKTALLATKGELNLAQLLADSLVNKRTNRLLHDIYEGQLLEAIIKLVADKKVGVQ